MFLIRIIKIFLKNSQTLPIQNTVTNLFYVPSNRLFDFLLLKICVFEHFFLFPLRIIPNIYRQKNLNSHKFFEISKYFFIKNVFFCKKCLSSNYVPTFKR